MGLENKREPMMMRGLSHTMGAFEQDVHLAFIVQLQGIQEFEQGNIRASRKLFAEAFAMTNRLFSTAGASSFFFPGSPLVPTCMGSLMYSEKSILQEHTGEYNRDDDTKVMDIVDYQGKAIPIYSRILKLPRRCTPNQFVFLSLYNLAISTHLAALHSMMVRRSDDHETQLLIREASEYWELAYAFQWRDSLALKPIHALSILVNLGHIQSLMGNGDASKKCFENVLSACQILQGRNQEIPKKEFFLYQAFRMLGMTYTHAASAA